MGFIFGDLAQLIFLKVEQFCSQDQNLLLRNLGKGNMLLAL